MSEFHQAWTDFQKHAYKTAENHGFHLSDSDEPDIFSLQFQQRLMLIISEVVEAHEYLRKGHDISENFYGSDGKPHGVAFELADVVIRIADLAECYGLDLAYYIKNKMRFNETREHLHGKRF